MGGERRLTATAKAGAANWVNAGIVKAGFCWGGAQNGGMTIPGELVRELAGAKSVAVLTGAGVSAESGVPTYRDAQAGLWAKYSPQELDTPGAFLRNPNLVHFWVDMT